MAMEYDSKWPDIDLFPNAPLPLLIVKPRPSTLLGIGFVSTLLSNVKIRIYFLLQRD